MRTTSTAHGWHRAHHIRAVVLAMAAFTACSGSLPRPPTAPLETSDWVAVSSAPRTVPVEFVPAAPHGRAVWVDGSWEWSNDRYAWSPGTWAVPPSGARRTPWALTRRKEDGQLFFAPSTWKDAAGAPLEDTSWLYALGLSARARSRLGGDPLPLSSRGRGGRMRTSDEVRGPSEAGEPEEGRPEPEEE